MKQEYVSTPLTFLSGEVLLPVGLGLAQLGEAFLNVFGNNDNIPAYVSPAQLLSLQDQTASRQLNYWSVDYTGIGGEHGQTRSYNLSWQQTLDNEGWPQQSRNIAISNGNECGADNGFAAGDPLLTIDSRSNPGFLLDAMNMLVAPLTGIATLDPDLFIIGTIPGSSRWQTNFNINTYGNLGSQNEIYRGRIRYEKKVLWIGPRITVDVTNQSYDAPSQALPFDTFSGGTIGFTDDGEFNQDIPIIEDLINVINESTGFIPVVSALDIKKANGNDPTPNDYLKSYAGGMPADPNLVSGFDAFIVDNLPGQPFNNPHLSFQVRNGNWLADELEAESPADYPVVENCGFGCTGVNITAPSLLCTSATFSVPEGADSVEWTVSPSNSGVSVTSGQGTNIAVLTLTGGYSGQVTVTANMMSNECGDVLSNPLIIWTGKPAMPNPIEGPTSVNTGALVNYQSGGSSGATSYEWWLPFPYESVPVFNLFGQNWQKLSGASSSPSIQVFTGYAGTSGNVQVMGRNSCGIGGARILSVTHGGSGGHIPRPAGEEEYNFVAYPNPSRDLLNVNAIDTSKNNGIYTSLSGGLYDLNGKEVRSVKFYNDKSMIDTNGLNKGVYVLKVYYDNKVETHQIIVE